VADEAGLLARWKLVLAASRDARLSRGDVAVLAAILDRMNDAGVAWPGLGTVATDAGIARRTAVRSVTRLVDLGYLQRASGDRTTSNRYRMGTPRDEPVPRDGLAPRDEPVTGVGTNLSLGVGTNSSPEPTHMNLPNEPEKPRAKRARTSLTFHEWCKTFPDDAELIDQNHAVFRFAERAKIPPEFMDLAWEAFHRLYGKGGLRERKRYTDWPRVVQNAIEGDWLRLWRFDQISQQYVLTTAGLQLQQALRAIATQKAA